MDGQTSVCDAALTIVILKVEHVVHEYCKLLRLIGRDQALHNKLIVLTKKTTLPSKGRHYS